MAIVPRAIGIFPRGVLAGIGPLGLGGVAAVLKSPLKLAAGFLRFV
jgi:hypothetical protein